MDKSHQELSIELQTLSGTLDEHHATSITKIGKEQLTDKDILLLAAHSIVHSFTYDEKGYTSS